MKQFGQLGFSLLELLIANLLGLLLLLALTQIYLNIKNTYQLQQAIVTIEEHARFSIYSLNQQIRMAGYADCEKSLTPTINVDAVQGYSTNTLPGFLKFNRIVANTDILVIKQCAWINSQEKLLTIAFFIADTLQKNNVGQPIYGLYEKKISAQGEVNTQELASGVENMQLQFGISNRNKNIDGYKKIAQMQDNDWIKVKGIKITLLFNSINTVLKKSITPDRMLHKEWDTFIALRERQ